MASKKQRKRLLTPNEMRICANILQVFNASGLSVNQIHVKTGVSNYIIAGWIRAEAVPKTLTLLKVCNLMGWSIDAILGLHPGFKQKPEGRAFGERLKWLMNENGDNTVTLAQACKTTDSSTCAWANGSKIPDVESLARICWLYKVSAKYMLEGR